MTPIKITQRETALLNILYTGNLNLADARRMWRQKLIISHHIT